MNTVIQEPISDDYFMSESILTWTVTLADEKEPVSRHFYSKSGSTLYGTPLSS